jgi:SM-20-related protein
MASLSSALLESIDSKWVDDLAKEIKLNGYAVRDGVSEFSGVNINDCRLEAENMRGEMKCATISTGMKNNPNSEKRSDLVVFLKCNDELAATSSNLHKHLKWIDQLRQSLDVTLQLKMEQCTYMLAEYPSGGSKYVKHRDAAPSEYAGRKLTALLYLNEDWKQSDGGELHLWPGRWEVETPLVFSPIMDRLIVFRSSLEHEVQPSFFHRIAVTTWFVNRRHQALELMCEHLSLKQDEMDAKESSAADSSKNQ